MSIITEINRIKLARNRIKNKLVTWGVAEPTDNITVLSQKLARLANYEGVSEILSEGDTYSIPAGYHDGSGTLTAAMTHQVLDITHANREQFKAGVGIKGAKNLVLPNITSIGEWAFKDAQELKVVDLGPDLAFMNYNAFVGCSNLTTLIFRGPCCDYGGFDVTLSGTPIDNKVDGAYIYVPDQYLDTYKTHRYWPLYSDRFKSLSELEGGGGSVEIDAICLNVTTVSNAILEGQVKVFTATGDEFIVKKAVLPNLSSVGGMPIFGGSGSSIETLDIGNDTEGIGTVIQLSGYSFAYNSNLKTLIFRGMVATPAPIEIELEGTSILSGNGYIYVPDALLNTYKTTSSWSSLAAQIKPISELEGE